MACCKLRVVTQARILFYIYGVKGSIMTKHTFCQKLRHLNPVLLVTGALLFTVGFTHAQDKVPKDFGSNPFKQDTTALPEPDFKVEAGFISNLSGSGSYQYLRPGARFPLSERLSLNGGLLISQGHLFGGSEIASPNIPQKRVSLDFAGTYAVSDNFMIRGATRLPLNNRPTSTESYRLSPAQQRAFQFQAAYNIGDHMQIEAGVQYQEGGYPLGPQQSLFNSGRGSFSNQWGRSWGGGW